MKTNIILITLALIISISPYLMVRTQSGGMPFTGTDDRAKQMITQVQPDYTGWAHPLWQPTNIATERLLFGLQAVSGAGLFWYCLRRRIRGRRPVKPVIATQQDDHAPTV